MRAERVAAFFSWLELFLTQSPALHIQLQITVSHKDKQIIAGRVGITAISQQNAR
jgi:hypothetical protein